MKQNRFEALSIVFVEQKLLSPIDDYNDIIDEFKTTVSHEGHLISH